MEKNLPVLVQSTRIGAILSYKITVYFIIRLFREMTHKYCLKLEMHD